MSLAWTVKWDPRAVKELKHLSYEIKVRIFKFFEERIHLCSDLKALGKALMGNKIGLWCYRIGDYRAICKIEDDSLTVLVLKVSHRREVYN